MFKILTVANNKGGVSKTTTVQCLAAYFSKQGTRTLLLDSDAQCNLTSAMLDVDNAEEGIEFLPAHPVTGDRYDISNIFLEQPLAPYPTNLVGVDIIPCKPSNIYLDKESNDLASMLGEFLNQGAVQEEYDLIIIDTPPAKGLLTTSAIRCSTHILIPVVMENKSVTGLLGMMSKIDIENEFKSMDNQSEVIGILPSKVDARYRIHKDYLVLLNDAEEYPGIAKYMVPGHILDQGSQLASFVIKERPALKEMELTNASPKTPFAMNKSTDIYKEWNALGLYISKELGLC
jgi:chromosome partitioning protein